MSLRFGQHTGGVDTAGGRVRSVVVVDDQRTFADLLREVVDGMPDLECIGAAYDLDTAVDLVSALRPDVVVMDVRFQGDSRDGVTATAEITARFPSTMVLLLTASADQSLITRAAKAGACGLAAKSGSLTDLISALRTIRPGGLTVHASLTGAMADQPQTSAGLLNLLSPRERDVLGMLTIGLDSRAVADQLDISLHTCRGYVKSLLRKLGAHSQLEAVAVARRLGYVDAASRV